MTIKTFQHIIFLLVLLMSGLVVQSGRTEASDSQQRNTRSALDQEVYALIVSEVFQEGDFLQNLQEKSYYEEFKKEFFTVLRDLYDNDVLRERGIIGEENLQFANQNLNKMFRKGELRNIVAALISIAQRESYWAARSAMDFRTVRQYFTENEITFNIKHLEKSVRNRLSDNKYNGGNEYTEENNGYTIPAELRPLLIKSDGVINGKQPPIKGTYVGVKSDRWGASPNDGRGTYGIDEELDLYRDNLWKPGSEMPEELKRIPGQTRSFFRTMTWFRGMLATGKHTNSFFPMIWSIDDADLDHYLWDVRFTLRYQVNGEQKNRNIGNENNSLIVGGLHRNAKTFLNQARKLIEADRIKKKVMGLITLARALYYMVNSTLPYHALRISDEFQVSESMGEDHIADSPAILSYLFLEMAKKRKIEKVQFHILDNDINDFIPSYPSHKKVDTSLDQVETWLNDLERFKDDAGDITGDGVTMGASLGMMASGIASSIIELHHEYENWVAKKLLPGKKAGNQPSDPHNFLVQARKNAHLASEISLDNPEDVQQFIHQQMVNERVKNGETLIVARKDKSRWIEATRKRFALIGPAIGAAARYAASDFFSFAENSPE